MACFLGRRAFPGPAIEREHINVSFVAQTRFRGVIVWTEWPRDEVATILPPDLRLARNVSSQSDRHPVVFTFGDHGGSALLWAGLTLPTGVEFPELMVAIPFVHHEAGHYQHVFIPRVLAGEGVVTWSGNAHYGFGKQMVDMQWLGRTFLACGSDGSLLAHATVDSEATWVDGGTMDLPNLSAVRDVFQLPILGRRADGSYASCYFDWSFAEGVVRPAAAVVSVDTPLGSGLGPRVCHGVDTGTFELRDMQWRISWAGGCRF